jgi:hypothetical protein
MSAAGVEVDPASVSLEMATAADQALLANLLELYVYDLSAVFPNVELGADGRSSSPLKLSHGASIGLGRRMILAFAAPPLMSFDASSLLASLMVSSIGFVLLSYGKKMSRPPAMLAGLVLLVYPYFIANAWLMLPIAAVLLGLLWLAVKSGY